MEKGAAKATNLRRPRSVRHKLRLAEGILDAIEAAVSKARSSTSGQTQQSSHPRGFVATNLRPNTSHRILLAHTMARHYGQAGPTSPPASLPRTSWCQEVGSACHPGSTQGILPDIENTSLQALPSEATRPQPAPSLRRQHARTRSAGAGRHTHRWWRGGGGAAPTRCWPLPLQSARFWSTALQPRARAHVLQILRLYIKSDRMLQIPAPKKETGDCHNELAAELT